MITNEDTATPQASPRRPLRAWAYDLLLIYVLLAGLFFRGSGLFWGENQYLHPDERFLVWVGTDISPVNSISEYFDTPNSSLNPQNRGHGFYVYGTLPMFLTRYVVEWVYGHSGFGEMTEVGRALSTLVDLSTVVLVYLVAARLYDRRVAILSAAFSAAAVLQIQQSHFFTMDTFINFFSFLAFYFAVRVLMDEKIWRVESAIPEDDHQPPQRGTFTSKVKDFIRDPLFLLSIGFGLALGMAVASKLNAAPMAVVLPAAIGIRLITLPPSQRQERAIQAFIYLLLTAFVSLVAFRIFQPYAFSGPGFFGLKPNPEWLANIRELRAQSTGDVDFPPAMQWARRPPWFSLQNLAVWGLGLPLGILGWAGFLWVGWRLVTSKFWRRGEWQVHALMWGWTALYFTWQSMALNPTMRYQLPIYPTLAIFAAWAAVTLYDRYAKNAGHRLGWRRLAALLIAILVLVATFAYAFGFSRIYVRPITRIAATRWIYQNIPGPITLPIESEDGVYNQPLPFPYTLTITPGVPFGTTFKPNVGGTLNQVILPRVKDEYQGHQERELILTIAPHSGEVAPLATAALRDDLSPLDDPRGKAFTLTLDQPVSLDPEGTYHLKLELTGEPEVVNFDPEISLGIQSNTDPNPDPVYQAVESQTTVIGSNAPAAFEFAGSLGGKLTQIRLSNLANQDGTSELPPMRVSVINLDELSEAIISETTLQPAPDGSGHLLRLHEPIPIHKDMFYSLILELEPSGGMISLSGLGIANEGDWDDGLPLRMDGYDGFGGIYPLDLNFNMYWDDNPDKLDRFTRILDEADYIAISSSRQWGSLPRLPERFPMTTIYYRHLLGCPATMTIENCYNVAEPGMYIGDLGYELVETFISNPGTEPFTLNDQFAEEAFTVYDHPKVFIFRKTTDYDPERVSAILGTTNFSEMVRVPPMRASSYPENLLLPDHRLAEQRQGGTWSNLFDLDALQNRYQWLSLVLWYLSLSLLGLITYPLLRLTLPGLADRGYPLARTAGLLLLSYLVWLAGSLRIPFTRPTISLILGFLALVGILLAYWQRRELAQEVRSRGFYFLAVEALFLGFFLLDLFIRISNPDLWHPWKGGEKPMDFAYLNAVLKSTSFPPFDPWYAGGYLNYYYYGFVLASVLVKWLEIIPSIAYNLILPSLFSLVAIGAFSLTWNLTQAGKSSRTRIQHSTLNPLTSPYIPAIAAALGTALLGNLGTVRMIFRGYQKLIAPGGVTEGASLLMRWVWALRGFLKTLQGANLPYGIGDWYWIPSRAIAAQGDVEPITEFPFFTVLYADLHAHLFALPLTLLALAFAISIVLGRARWRNLFGGIAGFFLGALAIGALRPTNTWDFYPYLALGAIAVGYAILRNFEMPETLRRKFPMLNILPPWIHRILAALIGVLMLIGLAFLLFQPYSQWYALGYGEINLWKGTHTSITDYLTHWGLFLFVIISWMVWETRDWMAKTPLSALNSLKRFRGLIQGLLLALVLVALVLLFWLEVRIAWFVLPLAAWAAVLLLRPDQPDSKRIVLFLVGSALSLTLIVEIIVLVGDIGRMNTVFKFYLQAWTMFAISAGAALGWLLLAIPKWSSSWRNGWQAVLVVLVFAAGLYPLMAGMAKMKDRMAPQAPYTLDGMAFMEFAEYGDQWGVMDLSQDYRAIRWMQENVEASPVIVEANLRALYHWGSRFSNFTGLPGVVGWEWHQQQQRAVVSSAWVSQRIAEIDDFYLTEDLNAAQDFLRKYDVQYIIVGQQERGHYPGPGLDKFPNSEGVLWREVYRDGDTVIYEVIG